MMMFWLKVAIVCQCFQYIESLSKSDPLRWVPPRSHDWKNNDIAKNVKVHWENRWAKASFQRGCAEEGSLEIIPVYFWPEERVDLPCKMCHMAYLMNGRMKRWGYSKDIDDFLLNPKQFVRVNELWEDVQNTETFDKHQEDVVNAEDVIFYPHSQDPKNLKNFTSRVKKAPRYWQNDGKLSIFSADVRTQGVYFCYDEFSRRQTSIFYVLMAMLPPVRVTSTNPTIYTDHCGHGNGEDSSMVFPSHNWRHHFLPMGDFNPPQTCKLDETDAEGCSDKYSYLNKTRWPTNLDQECTLNGCRARLFSPDNNIDLFLELRWDAWTSCEGDQPTKRREAHCYIVRGQGGSINIEHMDSKHQTMYSWIKNLETVFDRKPFDIRGIRLHSSLITSAIFDKPMITGCFNKKYEEEGLYKKYDEVWRRVFLPTFGVPELGEVVQLRNPFEACIRYVRIENEGNKVIEHLVGTYSTQVDYC